MGLFSRHKLKIKIQMTKKDGFSGWVKCTHCNELIHVNELHQNFHCCPKCDYHYRLTATQRICHLADAGTFTELFTELQSIDPLQFVDVEAYTDRIKNAKEKSGRDEGVLVGTCTLNEAPIAIGILDFSFMAGSMGSVVGEKITRLIEYAIEHELPLILISASGGARMQESILSLMQMAKTSAALAKLHEKGLPYLSILTNPTLGGITASFASLGDVIIAEPDALIGFAGPRVVEQTIGQKLPPKAQKSEFLLEKGMIDCIVNRHELKEKISELIFFLMNNEREYEEPASYNVFYRQPLNKLPERLKELMTLTVEEEISNFEKN